MPCLPINTQTHIVIHVLILAQGVDFCLPVGCQFMHNLRGASS